MIMAALTAKSAPNRSVVTGSRCFLRSEDTFVIKTLFFSDGIGIAISCDRYQYHQDNHHHHFYQRDHNNGAPDHRDRDYPAD